MKSHHSETPHKIPKIPYDSPSYLLTQWRYGGIVEKALCVAFSLEDHARTSFLRISLADHACVPRVGLADRTPSAHKSRCNMRRRNITITLPLRRRRRHYKYTTKLCRYLYRKYYKMPKICYKY